jgi:hypothetical protein
VQQAAMPVITAYGAGKTTFFKMLTCEVSEIRARPKILERYLGV